MDAMVFGADAVGAVIGLVPFGEDERVPRGAADIYAAKIEPYARQQPIEPLVPSLCRGKRFSRSTEGVLAEKGVLEARCEGAQHGLGVAAVDGGEQAPDAIADNGVVHGALHQFNN